ncbi:recombinase family protein [Polyangium fumosum]|uniref:Recombinase family protein n=1 Tax=Polyangium fumosum TaxID=889272 RepID=A0A4U1JCG1_9BACT|nr:recombinase family protein [Polyangium fumosum]TKD07968.1 hypothetical protein E8A74_16960 [Polyangium fumosum]
MKDVQSWGNGPAPERWWAFYVRVTREESIKRDLSIPNQCARAQELARLRGWDHFRIYIEERHVSAELWTDKRPALKRMLDDLSAGFVLGVCARHTDRLWRNNDIQGRILRMLRGSGSELWDFSSRYDYKSAHGRFSLQVLGAASELEVGLVAERIREMKRGKAMKGKTGGGPAPYGYTSQSRRIRELKAAGLPDDEAYRKACLEFPVGKCWYIDEYEAAVVRLIFDLYTSPKHRIGSKLIARHLNQQGYRPRLGDKFTSGIVTNFLDNPAYAGYTHYDEIAYTNRVPSTRPRRKHTLFQGEHPAIVPPEVWHKAQDIKTIESRTSRRKTAPGAVAQAFSLTGIMRCPKCGTSVLGRWARPEMKYLFYICGRRHGAGPEGCDFPLIRAMELQNAVWGWLCEVIASPAFVMRHVERLMKRMRAEQPATERQLAALRKRRDSAKGALGKYLKLFESSTSASPEPTFLDRIRELRAEFEAVEAEIAKLEARVVPTPPKVDEESVRRYLAKLSEKVSSHEKYQRVLFHEFQREHDFQVRPAESGTEFAVSMALPCRDMASAASAKRIATVLGWKKEAARSRVQRPEGAERRLGSEVNGSCPWRLPMPSATISATLCMARLICRARSLSFRSIRSAIPAASPAITKTTS